MIGNNNALSTANQNISFECFELHFFTSKTGLLIYLVIMFLLMVAWCVCYVANPVSIVASLFIIPVIFFVFGSAYLKCMENELFLKIHRILFLASILSAAISLFSCTALILLGVNSLNPILFSTSVNMIASFGLYFNSFGEGSVIDFVIKTFQKAKRWIKLL